jgi:hypothetical protein
LKRSDAQDVVAVPLTAFVLHLRASATVLVPAEFSELTATPARSSAAG